MTETKNEWKKEEGISKGKEKKNTERQEERRERKIIRSKRK